jgi:hypothetical protein
MIANMRYIVGKVDGACGLSSAEEVADLGVLRETTFPLLREDELPVHEDVVLALRALLDRSLVLCP